MREFKFEPLELVGEATILDTSEFNQLLHDIEELEVQKMLLKRDNETLVDIANKTYEMADIAKKLLVYLCRKLSKIQEEIDTFFID